MDKNCSCLKTKHSDGKTNDEPIGLLTSILTILTIVALFVLMVIAPYFQSARNQNNQQTQQTVPSYFYTQEIGGRVFTLLHDPLAEQEGGLRSMVEGFNQNPHIDWINQFEVNVS